MRIFKISRRIIMGATMSAGVALALPVASQAMPAAKPPTVSTGAATQVSDSSATLGGAVNPHGAESTCYFQYGPTIAYGAQTPTAAVGSGTVQVKVSQAIAGLQLGTAYHYRLVAMTSAGAIVDGQDHTFTTKKIPLKLKLAKLLGPVTYGSRFTIEGALSGTGNGNHEVVLQSNPFPFLGSFANLTAPVLTSATGGFSLSVAGLTQNTELRVSTLETPSISSPAMTVHVAVKVTLHARPTGRKGYVRLYGTITPALVGAPVAFQFLRPGLGPATTAGTLVRRGTSRVGRFSSVVFVHHGRGGSYRALVRVTNGELVSGYSSAVLIHSAPAPVRKRKGKRR